MSQFTPPPSLLAPAPAVSARDWATGQQTTAWFRMVYDRDGWPLLRARSARVNSGLVLSSDPTVGGFIACPFERLAETVTPAGTRRLQTFVSQTPPTGVAFLSGQFPPPWGPLLLDDLVSDDHRNPYTPPAVDPVTGVVRFDSQLLSQQVYLWTASAPTDIGDLDPVFVELQRRADHHWLQQELGTHHRLELQVDSALSLSECGQELYVYWPENAVFGWFQIISMSQPLSEANQTWTCRFVSRSVP